jgi:hypothetical protein
VCTQDPETATVRVEGGETLVTEESAGTGGFEMSQVAIRIDPIGIVECPLTDPASAPNQGDEGAPDAWLVLRRPVLHALDGIRAGD